VTAYPDPKRENGAYKWFIEQMRDLAAPSYAKRLSENGHLERRNDADLPLTDEESRRKEFFLKLSADDRQMLGQMCDAQKRAAIHDVCAFLEGYLACDEMKISFADQDIPASPYGTMHYDLVAIMEGDEWPDEQRN
jgi:hypothetical protein